MIQILESLKLLIHITLHIDLLKIRSHIVSFYKFPSLFCAGNGQLEHIKCLYQMNIRNIEECNIVEK